MEEGAWREKCSSAWTPQPPAADAPASSPVNQMVKNPPQNFRPIIVQGTNVENHPAVQEPLVFHTLNLDFPKSGKSELNNSFLALLSANPRNLPSEFSQSGKLHAHTGGVIVSSASPGAQVTSMPSQVTSIPSFSQISTSGSMWSAKNPSFVEHRASLIPSSNKDHTSHNSLHVATSHCRGSAASKQVPDQAFQGPTAGKPTLSCSWPSNSRRQNTNQHHPSSFQSSQRVQTEAGSTVPSHDSTRSRGRPRVICMNTVGELFLSELGLLGVICFCHGLRMSVAKFCEHSGSSANPGEVVHLENGMTVAHWRKLCFGNNAPDDYKGWDWSDGPSNKIDFIGSRGSTLPTLPQNLGTVDSIHAFVGLRRARDPWNTSYYAMPPCTGVRQTGIKHPTNEVSDNMYQKNKSEGEGFTSPSQIYVPVLAKNPTMHAIKGSLDRLNPEASRAALNKGQQNTWSHSVTDSNNCKEKLGSPSVIYPHSDAGSRSCEFNRSKDSFGSEVFVVTGDDNSSNIDLRLGQPSEVHTSLSSLPTFVNSLQFSAASNPQKSQVDFPLTEKFHYPMETKQQNGLWHTSFEPSISNRGQSLHVVGSSKNSSHSEAKDLMGSATKNSLISMFLSHLNTEGGSTSQLNTIVNDSKFSTLDSVSAKCNLSEHINKVNGKNQRNNFLDGSDISNNIDKGKRLRNLEKGPSDTAKVNYMVHNKQMADTRVRMPAMDGQCLFGGSSMDDTRFSFHFNEPSTTLQSRPESMKFNHYGKLPFGRNRDHCNHTTNSSMDPVSHAAPRPGPLNAGIPMNVTSLNSLYMSETGSALKRVKGDHIQHLADENMKHLALRHMVELSKQEHSIATPEVSPRHQRLCCHAGIELQRNLCNGDTTTAKNLRQRAYCDIQQNASEFTVRSLQSCSHCLSGNGAEMLAVKPATRGRNEHCECTTLTERISQCSKEQDSSTCLACCADEHPCLRLTRMSNFSSGIVKQIFDAKEQSTSFHGKCCCSVLSKHLAGCCFTGHFNPSDSNKEQVCGKVIIEHITGACNKIHRSQGRKTGDLCECSKKHFVMKNDCQIGLWRDVPAKKLGHSDATSVDKPPKVLKNSEGTGDRLLGTSACKGFEGTQQDVEQQMSNVCSGSSAHAVTEISVEVNKVNYCAINVEDNKTAYDVVADEGSGVEKCGSSDEALDNRAVNGKVDLDKSGCSLPSRTSGDHIDELRKETSSNKKIVKNQMHIQGTDQDDIKKGKVEKAEKRKEQMKMNKLDMLVPKSGLYPRSSESSHCVSKLKWELSLPDKSKALSQPESPMQKVGVKRKRSSLSSTEPFSLKTKSHCNILEFDEVHSLNDDQSLRTLTVASEKEELNVHTEKQFAKQEEIHLDSEKPPKYMSLSCIAKSNNHETETAGKKVRPVVCGKSGIISNGGLSGQKKPPKIVSLSLILKRSKGCDVNEHGTKPKKSSTLETKKMLFKAKNRCCNELSSSKLQCRNEDSKRTDTVHSFGTNNQCSSKSDEHVDELSVIENEINSRNEGNPVLHHECKVSQARPRYREVRKCSLSKLLSKDKNAAKMSCEPNCGAGGSPTMDETGYQPKASTSTVTSNSLVADVGLGKRSLNNEDHAGELSQINARRSGKVRKSQPLLLGSDAFCSVCGSSITEEFNCILECNRCLIRVHQACYGVSKVPRGHWFCRPCKTNSQNTVCVLCGYEGGALTKAVKSQITVRSLLKAWNFGTFMGSVSSEKVKGESAGLRSVIEASKCDNSESITAVRSACSEAFLEGAVDLSSENQSNDQMPKGLQLYNSVTAGVFDPSVTQWVHMVCGLWTPGTLCPNVDTMSAFDVSGASAARKSIVCSMCNRAGGCCIQCRVLKCSVHFHPWCAHQKGLLQSEIEGDDNEKVGFYGRCMLHAAQDDINEDYRPAVNSDVESPKRDWSCARTEGFKDRKSEGGFKSNHQRLPNNDNGGCVVSQEQINAWLHINGQKLCTRAIVKLPCSDVEYDFRKEYYRYKQTKAWKQLVVYKSGIHALGLYTSQLIARGAMVVEYVGEIVGLRVADKRELEYQSGRRLQYKSACYFFRIDKENIIDATCRGGVARFVNHSCQPNCVAKVISVRNEKKVVFFAERDINPGEEITYDYHFNSEDEGQKIPCYCNSKTCRQYLN